MRQPSNFQLWSPGRRLPVIALLLALASQAIGSAAGDEVVSPPRGRNQLETLRAALHGGDFDRFVELANASFHASAVGAQDPALLRLQVEALLSVGENGAADAKAAAALSAQALGAGSPGLACDEMLLRQWLTARWRQGRPLNDDWLERCCRAANIVGSPTLSAAAFWSQALAGKAPYRFVGAATTASLPMDNSGAVNRTNSAGQGRGGAEPAWIAVDINQVRLPRALIDTGNQHTLIATSAAVAAGVELAAEPIAMTGFSQFSARPGILRKLEIGGIALTDVPVLVGDSPLLDAASGQAALGIDLLSHLRVVLDYPARQVLVASVDRGATPLSTDAPDSAEQQWEATIPLWTFSFAALAQAQLPNQRLARALIDTGAWGGPYVSTAWADETGRGFSAASGRLVSRRRQASRLLANWRVGGLPLQSGDVRGMFPRELDRLGAFDVLVGNETLSGRRVEIDLAARRMKLGAVQSAVARDPRSVE